jgi:hypothetical protein
MCRTDGMPDPKGYERENSQRRVCDQTERNQNRHNMCLKWIVTTRGAIMVHQRDNKLARGARKDSHFPPSPFLSLLQLRRVIGRHGVDIRLRCLPTIANRSRVLDLGSQIWCIWVFFFFLVLL